MLPAAILDVDGTLVDSNYLHVAAWSRAFAEHGVVVPGWMLHRAVGMGGDRFVPAVVGEEAERSLGDDVRARHDELFQEDIHRVAVLPGAHELLAELLERGHRIVLASSAKEEEIETYVDLLGVRERVDWTTSADVESTKPAPDLVAVAHERAGGGPAVMVGDTVWDVASAERAGLPAIALLSGGFGYGELRDAGAVLVLDDAHELCERLGETPLAGARTDAGAGRP